MEKDDRATVVDEILSLESDFVRVAQLALQHGHQDAQAVLRRLARRYRNTRPELASGLVQLLRDTPLRAATATPVPEPVDGDSRLPLIRQESPVVLPIEPVFKDDVSKMLEQVSTEHLRADALLEAGLAPTRTALFIGPPGVGKTLAARWLARSLGRPLIVLDLASVMSSFLGRTGVNVKRVLDYAKASPCVLLLDELDAVAKRRDDVTELGELKRLVTVLLQEIDSWPEGSLLLAATNHSELLDPAVWRRFEVHVDFPLPDEDGIRAVVAQSLDGEALDPEILAAIGRVFIGSSYSDVQRQVLLARRRAALSGLSLDDALLDMLRDRFHLLPSGERGQLAAQLLDGTGLSQRRVHELTGVARDTLRKYAGTRTAPMKGRQRA